MSNYLALGDGLRRGDVIAGVTPGLAVRFGTTPGVTPGLAVRLVGVGKIVGLPGTAGRAVRLG